MSSRQSPVRPPKGRGPLGGPLSAILKEDGFQLVENWPSLFYKRTPKGPILIDVYVDDLIMYGPRGTGGLRDHIDRLRQKVSMEGPTDLCACRQRRRRLALYAPAAG